MYKKNINKFRGLKILESPNYCESNYWLNILIIDEKKFGLSKKSVINLFKKKGIETRSVWYPNHLQKPYKKFEKFELSNSYRLYKKSICLPSSYSLNITQQKLIIKLLKNKFK